MVLFQESFPSDEDALPVHHAEAVPGDVDCEHGARVQEGGAGVHGVEEEEGQWAVGDLPPGRGNHHGWGQGVGEGRSHHHPGEVWHHQEDPVWGIPEDQDRFA